jgi:putative transposase
MRERSTYPTDLTDEEYGYISKLVPAVQSGTPKGGRPCEYERREIVNGILYVVRSGCAWRLMPHDLPPWNLTFKYFSAWKKDGTWRCIHDKLRGELRRAEGRDEFPTAGVIDSQSVKTTEKGGRAVTMRARKSVDARGTCSSTRSGC